MYVSCMQHRRTWCWCNWKLLCSYLEMMMRIRPMSCQDYWTKRHTWKNLTRSLSKCIIMWITSLCYSLGWSMASVSLLHTFNHLWKFWPHCKSELTAWISAYTYGSLIINGVGYCKSVFQEDNWILSTIMIYCTVCVIYMFVCMYAHIYVYAHLNNFLLM